MGVLALPVGSERANRVSRDVASVCAAVLYAIVVALAVWHHEPWADEAQSWLLARDAGLADLWTRLLHYEGTPGLWQTLLHLLIRLGLPYRGLNIVSAASGFAAAWLIIRLSPFPLPIRLALPFTFFLCYQYTVIARSYSLLPLLLIAAAILYRDGARRIAALTVTLGLMSAVSVHGMVLACSIWLSFHLSLAGKWRKLSTAERKRVIAAAACYMAAVSLLILSAWPAADNIFVTGPYWSFDHLWKTSLKTVSEGFAGNWIPSLAAIALSLPLLRRGRALLIFLSSLVSLSLVNAVVYSQVWHQGLVFLGWLFAVWVAATRVKPGWTALASLAIVICFQCYWTVESIRYDWRFPYSGSREAASYLKQTGIPRQRLFAIGYACVGIQPYFPRNIFANMYHGGGPAYWDWSTRNHVNEDSAKLPALAPDYVLVGYKGAYERDLWTGQIQQSGYRLVRHFEGNTFWRTKILEPESYDLYRRPAP